jgi:hypothetical protein
MRDGQQVPVDGIDRGMLLVYSHEHWLETYRRYMKGRLKFDVFGLGILGAVMVMAVMLFAPILSILMVLAVVLVGVTEVVSYRSTLKSINGGGPLPGVYSLGVELPIFPLYATRLFIPWTEMEDAWVKRSRTVDDVLYISVLKSRWRWRAPGRLFGQDGMQAVVERAHGPKAIHIPEIKQAAPKLVLYSAEGAKTESVPDGSTDPDVVSGVETSSS